MPGLNMTKQIIKEIFWEEYFYQNRILTPCEVLNKLHNKYKYVKTVYRRKYIHGNPKLFDKNMHYWTIYIPTIDEVTRWFEMQGGINQILEFIRLFKEHICRHIKCLDINELYSIQHFTNNNYHSGKKSIIDRDYKYRKTCLVEKTQNKKGFVTINMSIFDYSFAHPTKIKPFIKNKYHNRTDYCDFCLNYSLLYKCSKCIKRINEENIVDEKKHIKYEKKRIKDYIKRNEKYEKEQAKLERKKKKEKKFRLKEAVIQLKKTVELIERNV